MQTNFKQKKYNESPYEKKVCDNPLGHVLNWVGNRTWGVDLLRTVTFSLCTNGMFHMLCFRILKVLHGRRVSE